MNNIAKKLMATGAILTVLSFTACSNAVDDVLSAIDSGEYNSADKIYNSEIKGNEKKEEKTETELRKRLEEACENYNRGDISYEKADGIIESIEKSKILTPKETNDKRKLLSSLKKSKDSYNIGKSSYDAADYQDAYISFGGVIDEDLNYDSSVELRANAEKLWYEGLMSDVNKMLENKNYQEAYDKMTEAKKAFGDKEEFNQNYENIKAMLVDAVIEDAEKLAVENDYMGALDILKDALDDIGDCENKIVEKRKELTDRQYEYVLTSAVDAFGNDKDYQAAIRVLQTSGLTGEKIDDEIRKYQEYIPVSLTSMEYIQKGSNVVVGTNFVDYVTDVNEVTYNGESVIYLNTSLSWGLEEDNSYIVYYLNGKYSTLTGILYRPYGTLKSIYEWNESTVVKIYGDGVLLYEAPNITKSTYDPMNFSIDITGVRELKIIIMGYWTNNNSYGYQSKLCLADLMVQK